MEVQEKKWLVRLACFGVGGLAGFKSREIYTSGSEDRVNALIQLCDAVGTQTQECQDVLHRKHHLAEFYNQAEVLHNVMDMEQQIEWNLAIGDWEDLLINGCNEEASIILVTVMINLMKIKSAELQIGSRDDVMISAVPREHLGDALRGGFEILTKELEERVYQRWVPKSLAMAYRFSRLIRDAKIKAQ